MAASPYAAMCYTCQVVVWQGDNPPADGQAELTRYAEASCQVAGCPNKTAALAASALLRPVTVGEMAGVRKRLDALEAKVKP